MKPPNQHPRINLAELKAQIMKKLGPEGSKQYFYYLNSFLNLKLSKVEFNKHCLRILRRENIPLHNQFIRSILRNACTAKTPPPASNKDDVLRHGTQVTGNEISADGCQQNGSHVGLTQVSGSPGLSNGGDILPVSPRKARTGIRDRRTGDRRSALGPNGKTTFAPHLSTAFQSNEFNVILENGDSNPPDIGKPLQQSKNDSEILVPCLAKLSTIRGSPDGAVRNEGKEAYARSPLQAPLGVPLCPVSIGLSRRAQPSACSSRYIGTSSNCALLDSLTLRERMEQIAVGQGLEAVSLDCANILNHGLDLYMKGLIRSCTELVGTRSGNEFLKNNVHKHHSHMKFVNGVRPGHQHQIQNGGKPLELQEQKIHHPISLQDFRIAMELNTRQLGEDWPLLLEKVCVRPFEE